MGKEKERKWEKIKGLKITPGCAECMPPHAPLISCTESYAC